MLILGIGGWQHDGAAAILRDGKIVAAIEEEKLQRQPHTEGLPAHAIETCLQIAKASHTVERRSAGPLGFFAPPKRRAP